MSPKIERVQPVILCGGSGTRLWPLSRAAFPKQFLPLTCDESLFQLGMRRLNALEFEKGNLATPIVVTGENHRLLVAEQALVVGQQIREVILEPVPRNTAPAVTMAAFSAMSDGHDPTLVVTPSDQLIGDNQKFNLVISAALEPALTGSIVLIGVKPRCPETALGYLRGIKEDSKSCFKVEKFVEKPNLLEAKHLIEDEAFYWNAGIFVMKASVWISALKKFRPDIYVATEAAWLERSKDVDPNFDIIRPNASRFASIPAESIDFAVMENCPGTDIAVEMVELDANWSDLGSWRAVLDASPKDKNGNSYQGDVKIVASQNSIVRATDRLVVLAGLESVTVVETPDAVLVADNNSSQEIREFVGGFQKDQREEFQNHRKTYRPWGWFDLIDEGDGFAAKRIHVNPGASLSLQHHEHRSEHWVVVLGQATVVNGEQVLQLKENQSTYIPAGTIHRLSNPGSGALQIIEVQLGSYLREDDIVRHEDNYGRS